jgi:hypothetical protein
MVLIKSLNRHLLLRQCRNKNVILSASTPHNFIASVLVGFELLMKSFYRIIKVCHLNTYKFYIVTHVTSVM